LKYRKISILQNIDFNKTPLFKNVLNLIKVPQGINSIGVLPAKNKSRDKCSNSISDSINCNQMRISHLKLAFIIKRSNDQIKKTQLIFVVGIIDRELYIL